jgi:hypothetical protein
MQNTVEQAAVVAMNRTVLAPQMAQVLSSAQAAVQGQEVLTLRGQKVVLGVVTPKLVVVHEVFRKVQQAVQALPEIMVVVMVVVVVEEITVEPLVLVAQEVFLAVGVVRVLVSALVLQEQAVLVEPGL